MAFAERTFTDALLIMKDGRIVHEQYLNRTTERTRFMSYSMAKSLNSIMTGFAIAEGRIGCVPGQDFGPQSEGYVRFCTARSREELTGALESMRVALGATV